MCVCVCVCVSVFSVCVCGVCILYVVCVCACVYHKELECTSPLSRGWKCKVRLLISWFLLKSLSLQKSAHSF